MKQRRELEQQVEQRRLEDQRRQDLEDSRNRLAAEIRHQIEATPPEVVKACRILQLETQIAALKLNRRLQVGGSSSGVAPAAAWRAGGTRAICHH